METSGKGQRVENCPLKLEVCFPSCYWWTEKGCRYPSLADRKQLDDLKAMRQIKSRKEVRYG